MAERETDLQTKGRNVRPFSILPIILVALLIGCMNPTDNDGDGWNTCGMLPSGFPTKMALCDGNDLNADVFPGAPELCDGLDNNENGRTDEGFDGDADGQAACVGDCDDSDASIHTGAPELCDGLDNDCDLDVPSDELDADADGWLACAECDDGNALRYAGNPELCDSVDNDCDGEVPSNELDADADGASACEGDCNDLDASSNITDADGDLQSICAGDCDDGNALRYTGNLEVCDGVDNDCDLSIASSEQDFDADGARACTDCDDTNPNRFPENAETCDDVDNDCDGMLSDAEVDNDLDGYSECDLDCDDAYFPAHPGGLDIVGNAYDEDCDGLVLLSEHLDADGDGYCANTSICSNGFTPGDCDDSDATRYPGNAEVCDGIDNDCTGFPAADEVDQDADGWLACEECDDAADWNFPSNVEICDGADNDCNGALSDTEVDNDLDGMTECDGDCDDADLISYAGALEVCDSVDNDCNGVLSDFELDGDTDGITECDGDCDDAAGWNFPGNTEVCDGLDNDCNSQDDVLGYDLSETDNDLDGQTECDGDCDDTDSFLNTLDEDGDGFDTCFEGDCDDDASDGDASRPTNTAETVFSWSCSDWQDNDCDGFVDFEDADCTGACAQPDMSTVGTIPDGGFEGVVMNWFSVPTGAPSDDAWSTQPMFSSIMPIEGSKALRLLNLTAGAVEDEIAAVEFSYAAGPIILVFSGVTNTGSGPATPLIVRFMDGTSSNGNPLCEQGISLGPNFWRSYTVCCNLPPVAGGYQLQVLHGSQNSLTELWFDAVELYSQL